MTLPRLMVLTFLAVAPTAQAQQPATPAFQQKVLHMLLEAFSCVDWFGRDIQCRTVTQTGELLALKHGPASLEPSDYSTATAELTLEPLPEPASTYTKALECTPAKVDIRDAGEVIVDMVCKDSGVPYKVHFKLSGFGLPL